MIAPVLALFAKRLAAAIPILLVVSALVFAVLRVLPVDPAAMSMPPNATKDEIEVKRKEMGLDRPLPQQYAIWLGQTLRGDLGTSIHFRRGVAGLIGESLPATIELAALAMAIAAGLGFVGGLMLFHLRGSWRGEAADLGSTVLMSTPDFLFGLMFILAFGVAWPILPFTGRLAASFPRPMHSGFLLLDTLIEGRLDMFMDALKHMILPATALGLAFSVPIMRVLRSSLYEVDHADYIRQARLRGVSEGRILLRHTLKNAVLPTLTLMGVQFGFLFGGTLLIEVIYSYPGLGNLMVDAVRNADLPIIQAVALAYAVVVLIINMIIDGLYLVLNPRLRTA
ncbi:peptide/nickel transport system permease protein [Rhizobiales bacterium GAS191]|jgi:ABC-type dipeptide/oligopeptide/nickel transport system permease component|nr:peptide/nickel transport system permease protein [Rhizobiales bacterium GAS113]SEE94952.1 peptide/nickel transport system permease protein [Rhizobiales bacterium GAS191]